jgi:hypothetical protein
MKAQLKNLEVAKKKGFGFVKKTLKKILKEDFTEPTSFFYDSEFDYGEEEPMPILFVGEIPTLWKKYVKENKTSKTLAAGRCIFKDGVLNLEVKTGKGGKRPVLKEVYKMLLKPFAKAQFVDSVEGNLVASDAEEIETTNEEDTATEVTSFEDLLAEAAEYMKEAEQKNDILNGIVNELGPKIADIRNIVVTDALIKEAMEAMMIVQDLRTDEFLEDLKSWLKEIPRAASDELKAEAKALADKYKELAATDKAMDQLATDLEKLQKVQNPSESEVPPVDTQASAMLKNAMKRILSNKQDFFKKATEMFDTIAKAGEV